MKINEFFTNVLGANVRNARWSWGAEHTVTHQVFLRVWEHDIEHDGNGERVVVALDVPRRKSSGYAERCSHIEKMRSGAAAYGVVCKAADLGSDEVRRVDSFSDSELLVFGDVLHENGATYARIVGRIPVEELSRSQSGQSTLSHDLLALGRKKLDATTRDALVNARVGQGSFRSKVLALWDNSCCVTGSTTLDAVRASHIKPWRLADDDERLDPENGLPLVANLDALFDSGLICFNEFGELIVSQLLSNHERNLLGVSGRALTRRPSDTTTRYLAYHRAQVFRHS